MKSTKDQKLRRLKTIQGHLKAIERMVQEDKYCIDILTQSLAVQQALKQFDASVLENHLKTCVVSQIKKRQSKKSTQELMQIYQLARKTS